MELIKKLLPDRLLSSIRPYYHGFAAIMAAVYYGRPSEKMVVIGVTGTAGKSTTTIMLARIMCGAGKKCGYITTVGNSDGEQDFVNKHGVSMPGGPLLQKQLRQMLSKGCKYAVVECTSEGLAQNRHLGINFDIALFTNLSHAHVEAHGSFGNYQAAKSKLFEALQNNRRKSFFLQKIIGVNLDDPLSGYFLSFAADKKFGVTFKHILARSVHKVFEASLTKTGPVQEFKIDTNVFTLTMPGEFNSQNASLAAACANMLGVNLGSASQTLKDFSGVRGRMESVPNNLGLNIIVDYGCEPASFHSALEAAAQLPHNRLIHVFGSTGGHRDSGKRSVFGKTSAQYADVIIITNDDVYNSDAQGIANDIEQGIKSFALRKPQYEIILDRRSAIARALAVAKKGDIVLITGKGSEQFLVLPADKRIEWDEVNVVKEEIAKIDIGRN